MPQLYDNKSKTQTILELEQKIKLLEKQNATLEHRAVRSESCHI